MQTESWFPIVIIPNNYLLPSVVITVLLYHFERINQQGWARIYVHVSRIIHVYLHIYMCIEGLRANSHQRKQCIKLHASRRAQRKPTRIILLIFNSRPPQWRRLALRASTCPFIRNDCSAIVIHIRYNRRNRGGGINPSVPFPPS